MDSSQKTVDPIPPTATEHLSSKVDYADEISFIDILKFLRRQFRVIGGVTFVTMMIATIASLTTPTQARRELLLSLSLPLEMTLSPIDTFSDDRPSSIAMNPVLIQEEMVAVASLVLANDFPAALASQMPSAFVSASFSPSTDEIPKRFQLLLTSEEPSVIEEASQIALDSVQVAADGVAEFYLEPEIARLDLLIQRTQEKVTRLADQLPSTATNNVTPTELASIVQLSQQSVLAEEISRLIDYELQRDSLSALQTRDEPLVTIKVLMESQAQVSSSLLQRLVLSIIAGLMLGIFVAIVVDQVPRIRHAMSSLDA